MLYEKAHTAAQGTDPRFNVYHRLPPSAIHVRAMCFYTAPGTACMQVSPKVADAGAIALLTLCAFGLAKAFSS